MPRITLLVMATVAVTLVADVTAQNRSIVTGSVTYRERLALPATAVVEILLEDVSRADVASDVIARTTIAGGRSAPIPFELSYDAADIDGSHRYGIRARILEGERVLFAAAQPSLVLTQGHPTSATLALTMVSEPSASLPQRPAAEPLLTPTRLPPAIELSDLPASFAGTLGCADCPGIRYELSLFADDSYFLRTTRLGARGAAATPPVETLGSWVRSSDRRAILLETRGDSPEAFAVQDHRTLRKLDADGQPIAAVGLRDLRRAPRFTPIEVRAAMTGVYRVEGPDALFIECSTGQRWSVTDSSAGPAATLRQAAEREGARAGNAVFASIEGRVSSRRLQAVEAAAQGTAAGLALDVTRVDSTAIGKSCAPRFGTVPLENTSWRLTRLGSTSIAAGAPAQSVTGELGLSFRDESRSFGGNGGCNRLAGAYETDGEALLLTSVGTMRACATVTARETTFRSALVNARSYRILGRTLELFGADRQALARFEAVD